MLTFPGAGFSRCARGAIPPSRGNTRFALTQVLNITVLFVTCVVAGHAFAVPFGVWVVTFFDFSPAFTLVEHTPIALVYTLLRNALPEACPTTWVYFATMVPEGLVEGPVGHSNRRPRLWRITGSFLRRRGHGSMSKLPLQTLEPYYKFCHVMCLVYALCALCVGLCVRNVSCLSPVLWLLVIPTT